MKTVLLVRHATHAEVGKILSGRSEIALSDIGRAEATALVDALEDVPIASLHSSPRRRALETIAPIAAHTGLEVRITPALDEIDFGGFSARSFAELGQDDAWHRWNAERGTARCPGGETMGQAVERARAYLAELQPAEVPALCVTHCDIIRGVVAAQLGLGFERIFALDCDPASITTLALGAEGDRLVTLNARVRPTA